MGWSTWPSGRPGTIRRRYVRRVAVLAAWGAAAAGSGAGVCCRGGPGGGRGRAVGPGWLVAAGRGGWAGRVHGPAAGLLHPVVLFILAVNLALIVGIAWLDWPATSTVGA